MTLIIGKNKLMFLGVLTMDQFEILKGESSFNFCLLFIMLNESTFRYDHKKKVWYQNSCALTPLNSLHFLSCKF